MSDGGPKFEPTYLQVFIGGDFEVGQPRTVGELRQALRRFDAELASWGDDREVAEIEVHHGKIRVTLREGIPQ